MKKLKMLNPVLFVKDSLEYMQGYPKWYVWLKMPKVYALYFRRKIDYDIQRIITNIYCRDTN